MTTSRQWRPPAQTPAGAQTTAAQCPWPVHQGLFVRESQRPALLGTNIRPSRRSRFRSMSGSQQLAETDYEVSLKLDGKAESSGSVLFAFDLTFAGVFRVQNVPQEQLQPVIMIECPRLLFPFAREIVATSVRNGGFPPLLLDPVDFVSLYQQRMAQVQPAQATPPLPER